MSARDRERDEADKRRAIRIEADLREYEEQLKEKREALKKIHEVRERPAISNVASYCVLVFARRHAQLPWLVHRSWALLPRVLSLSLSPILTYSICLVLSFIR